MSEPLNILVVDDLHAERVTLDAALAELGERVVAVGSGRDALKFLLEHDAAVILLDVNMPEMDGFETASLIRHRPRSADTPIIFLTADSDELMASRGYALGAVDYLFRPFLPEVLRTKVRVFVALSRAKENIRRDADQKIALSREQAARAAAEGQMSRLRIMVEAGGILSRTLEGSAFESQLLGLMVPGFADRAGLVFLDAVHGVGASTWAWNDGAGHATFSAEAPPLLVEPLGRVLATGREEIVRRDGEITGVIAPLALHGETYGALAVAMVEPERSYDLADLEMVSLIASRTSFALENRRLYQELQERDRRKDEFLAMLSHELRNPLGAITTAVHLLGRLRGEDTRADRAREVIARQSAHLARMVDDLLEVSRVTTGRIALHKAPVDLCSLAERALETLRASGRLDQHDLRIEGESVIVEADPARMEQVLTNLIVNAVKYTDPGGHIRVTVSREDRTAMVRVSDDGIGIAADLLPRVFDVFVQGHQNLDRAEGGLGIGLTLVRKLVELQGGTIEAASAGSGKGSTFSVRLPVAEVAPAPSLLVEGTNHGTVRLRILVVEDNDDAREMLKRYLEIHGHEVHEAADGPSAVRIGRTARPQMALVDIGLPGFDGLEVARQLRDDHATASCFLVALTGYSQEQDRNRTLENGFDAHLVKPASAERIRAMLQSAARHAAVPTGENGPAS